jgi:hypothetical protein
MLDIVVRDKSQPVLDIKPGEIGVYERTPGRGSTPKRVETSRP